MAKKETLTKRSMFECKNCHAPVGDEAHVHPFRVDQGNLDYETFCPPCFVYIRRPLELHRFPGAYLPLHCFSCGFQSVGIGQTACSACGSSHVILIPPKVASA